MLSGPLTSLAVGVLGITSGTYLILNPGVYEESRLVASGPAVPQDAGDTVLAAFNTFANVFYYNDEWEAVPLALLALLPVAVLLYLLLQGFFKKLSFTEGHLTIKAIDIELDGNTNVKLEPFLRGTISHGSGKESPVGTPLKEASKSNVISGNKSYTFPDLKDWKYELIFATAKGVGHPTLKVEVFNKGDNSKKSIASQTLNLYDVALNSSSPGLYGPINLTDDGNKVVGKATISAIWEKDMPDHAAPTRDLQPDQQSLYRGASVINEEDSTKDDKGDLPKGWHTAWDPVRQHAYYYNHDLQAHDGEGIGRSQWVRPEDDAKTEPKKPETEKPQEMPQ
jgi:hypothetical protein